MEKRVCDHLVDALENLTNDELRKFKFKLNRTALKSGYSNIPKGKLEGAGPLELTSLLVSFYTEGYAAEVAAQVLSESDCKEEAERLLALTGKGGAVQTPEQSNSAASGTNGRQPDIPLEQHFIDRHRKELIQRVATVEGVLDILYDASVLNNEEYQRICSKTTSHDKMRELYRLVPSWNSSCKDKLYEAIKTKNRFLISDLEGR